MTGIIFIIAFSILISLNLSKYSVSEIIPSVFLSVMILLYPFYCLNRLRWGRNAVIILFFGLTIFCIYRFFKNRSVYSNKPDFIPVLGYLMIILIIALMAKDNYVWLWDSTRLWGAAPKALYYTERLQLGPEALVYPFMQSYPPGMSLLVYFTESFNKDFHEWQIYLTYGALVTSLMLPAIKNATRKSLHILPLFCLLILLIPCIATSNGGDNGYFYNTLFIDPVLGALFGYGIYISTETDYNDPVSCFRFILVLISLALLKDSGLLFSFTLFVLSILLYFHRHIPRTKTEIFLSASTGLSIILPWASWTLLKKHFDVTNNVGGLQNRLNPDIILSLLKNSISMPSIKYTSRGEMFSVSFSLIMVLLLELVLFYLILKKTGKYTLRLFITLATTISLSYIVFLMGFGMTYGTELPSFQRYTGTLTIAPLVYMFIVISDYILDKYNTGALERKRSLFLPITLSCVLIIDVLYVWEINTDMSHICPYEKVSKHSDYIKESVYSSEGISIPDPRNNIDLYLLYTGNPNDNCIESQRLYMNLIGSGIREKNNYYNMRIIDWDYYDEDPAAVDVEQTFQYWYESLLDSYDYIYIYDIDDRTKALFYEKTSLDPENGTLYKIDRDNARLIKCG